MTLGEPEATAVVRETLTQNARRAGLAEARIYVARGAHGKFRVRVVHDELGGLTGWERQAKLLAGIEDDVEDPELLTRTEEEWYGEAFVESEEPLPTWPNVLEESVTGVPLTFASDLDQDLPLPAIVTFYSLRGGVGRTTALAAAARILAARGRRVVCIDMDFEAPGLPYLFGLEEPELEHGALPLLLALGRGEEVDIRDHIQRVTEAEELYCLPAGKLGVEYAQRLRLTDPEMWYREVPNPLHRLVESAGKSSINPDIILLDARTGISPISAPLLFDISDLAVICFFPHPQASRGTELLVRSLLNARSRRSTEDCQISPEPRFLVSPVPPGPSAERVRDRAMLWIDDWLSRVHDRRSPEVGHLQGDELTYLVSYSPEMAFSDRLSKATSLQSVYGPVADWLEQLLPQPEEAHAVQSANKGGVLEELDFSTGTAEHQESFFEDFVRTRVSLQAMDRRYPLVVGRKGTGKTAVFRWLFEQSPSGSEPIPVMCPNAFRNRVPWALGANGFVAIEGRLNEYSNWQTFWSCYSALAAFLSLPPEERVMPPDRFGIDASVLPRDPRRTGHGGRCLEDALAPRGGTPRHSLAARNR